VGAGHAVVEGVHVDRDQAEHGRDQFARGGRTLRLVLASVWVELFNLDKRYYC
jgi:hypothetical protein